MFEIYRGTELLRKYKSLNQIGFTKILKKYDKIANVNASKLYLSSVVNEKSFVKSSKLDKLIREIEEFYSIHYEEGSRRRSMKKLRVPSKRNVRHYSSMWKTGLYLGLALPFFIQSVYLALNRNRDVFLRDVNNIDYEEYSEDASRYRIMQLYAAMGMPIIFMLMIGINMHVWTRARINYKFIFDFDPRDNIDYHQYLEIPSLMFLAQSIFMYLTIENTFGVRPEIYPKILIILNLSILFLPSKKFYYNARRWLIFTIGRIFLSPFTNVGFREFFIADELTSLSYSFSALQLFFCTCAGDTCVNVCFTSTSHLTPFLASIPVIARSLQCLRRLHDAHKLIHLINFGKYLSSVLSICMLFWYRQTYASNAKVFWIFSQCFYSTYTFIWDVKMDWRLLQPGSNLFLRDQLAYRRKWVYYLAIVTDLLLRWSWVLYLLSDTSIVGFLIAFGEMVRRWSWNFFRVENDHANNCAKSRAIGIDRIINKLMGDPIIDQKELKDFSTRYTTESEEDDGWRDFETRNGNEQYEYDDDDDDDDDYYYDDDDPNNRRYVISVDLSNNNNAGTYASRRLPLSIYNISEEMFEIQEEEEGEERESLSSSSAA